MGATNSSLYTLCKNADVAGLKKNRNTIKLSFFKYEENQPWCDVYGAPLFVACRQHSEELVLFLLEVLVERASEQKEGYNGVAAERIVEVLNMRNCYGFTVLGYAIMVGLNGIVSKILEYDVELKDVSNNHESALGVAIVYRNWDVAVGLVSRHGYLANVAYGRYKSSKPVAILCGMYYLKEEEQKSALPLLELLIEKTEKMEDLAKGFNVACKNRLEMFALKLLDGGCDIKESNEGKACLVVACKYKCKELAKKLIEKEACLEFRDTHGQTAFDFVVANGWDDIAQMMLDGGAKIQLTEQQLATSRVLDVVVQYKKVCSSSTV